MTMTCFVSMTLVSTFCCSVEARALLSFAFLRIRWTASMTSLCCARKALPRSAVHWMSSASRLTASGKAAIDWTAGSQGCFGHGVREGLVLEARVLREPLVQLDDLERVGGRREGLGEERVGVEGDRRHEGFELLGRELHRGLRRCCGRLRVRGAAAPAPGGWPHPGGGGTRTPRRGCPSGPVERFGVGTVRSPSSGLPFVWIVRANAGAAVNRRQPPRGLAP